jgi:hypothetical protein
MSPVTLSDAAAGYLAALERELADLPPDERAELLEEVEASPQEAGDGPVGRLGTPGRFAAELRASAGLPPAPAAVAPPRESAWMRFRRDPAVRAAFGTARELAPIWWVVRACALLAAFTVGTRESYSVPFPRLTGHPVPDVALVGLAITVSVALGLTGRRRPARLRPLRIAVNLGLVACLAFVPEFVDDVRGRATQVEFISASPTPAGPSENGVPLGNIYPYDAKGRLLHDVRVYDQAGRPLRIGQGSVDPDRRPVYTRGGRAIFNAFPIRYFEPDTNRVARPDATPTGLHPRPLR